MWSTGLVIQVLVLQQVLYETYGESEHYVVLKPGLKIPTFHETGSVHWESFLFYFYKFPISPTLPCVSQGLEVNFNTPTGDFLIGSKGETDCSVTPDTLSSVVQKVADDTLVFRLKGGKCYQATYRYEKANGRERIVEDGRTYDCSGFPTHSNKNHALPSSSLKPEKVTTKDSERRTPASFNKITYDESREKLSTPEDKYPEVPNTIKTTENTFSKTDTSSTKSSNVHTRQNRLQGNRFDFAELINT